MYRRGYSAHYSFSDKVKRVFSRTYKWSPTKDNEVREKVEDELFQL